MSALNIYPYDKYEPKYQKLLCILYLWHYLPPNGEKESLLSTSIKNTKSDQKDLKKKQKTKNKAFAKSYDQLFT